MARVVASNVNVNPGTLSLRPHGTSEFRLKNSGEQKLTYKLKTTRLGSVKPSKAFGVIGANGSDKIKVNFQPAANESPFLESDRVTVLVNVLPDSFKEPELFWKSTNQSDAHRVVIKLERAQKSQESKQSTASSVKEETESEESDSEPDETESEYETD